MAIAAAKGAATSRPYQRHFSAGSNRRCIKGISNNRQPAFSATQTHAAPMAPNAGTTSRMAGTTRLTMTMLNLIVNEVQPWASCIQ